MVSWAIKSSWSREIRQKCKFYSRQGEKSQMKQGHLSFYDLRNLRNMLYLASVAGSAHWCQVGYHNIDTVVKQ